MVRRKLGMTLKLWIEGSMRGRLETRRDYREKVAQYKIIFPCVARRMNRVTRLSRCFPGLCWRAKHVQLFGIFRNMNSMACFKWMTSTGTEHCRIYYKRNIQLLDQFNLMICFLWTILARQVSTLFYLSELQETPFTIPRCVPKDRLVHQA